MTSYNKPAYVGKAIEGILAQTHSDFELFLMDDNSDLPTAHVISSYLQDPRIRYIRSDIATLEERAAKVRYAALINQALPLATGDYITYATDDNVYRPNRLARMSEYLDQHPEANIVYSASITRHVKDDGTITKSVHRPAGRINWLASCAVDHCSIMHRRSVLSVLHERWGTYWDENPEFYRIGDARFFWRLNHFWPFHPIDEVLDDNYMTEHSFHNQLLANQQSRFVQLLPEQRTCKELREHLRALQSGRRI
ncbi:glycosyltransferase involved in cell wall biosynthesis [Paenibacillus phyllosphaerae]|uniref:Glycosyltransferase involved in cell wall biosynthesis n=2 Tax=Paenibacillus phyllosphaerae TaxID=274593 RepID=A0A7W5B2M8_9BACL|nr:glycosyltransferase involved in cell wall biosynthesis [Paenibacillus phyllosphaerae]